LTMSKEVLKVLLEYDWPGNIRQLKNFIERAVVLTEDEQITLDVLPKEILGKPLKSKDPEASGDSIIVNLGDDFREARKEFERKYIEKCLERSSGNITRAAALLGIHRQSLQQKIKELGLTKRFTLSE